MTKTMTITGNDDDDEEERILIPHRESDPSQEGEKDGGELKGGEIVERRGGKLASADGPRT